MFEFKFPDIGEGIHEGKVLQLTKNPGDEVKEGDIIAVVETDKVVADIPTSTSGILHKYSLKEGQIIEVGHTLAFIETDKKDEKKNVDQKKDEKISQPTEKQKEENANVVGELEEAKDVVIKASGEGLEDNAAESFSLASNPSSTVLATPLARKMIREMNFDINLIKGTGPAGRITKNDIEKYKIQQEQNNEEKSNTKIVIETLPTIRKTIAKNMEISGRIPTASLHEQILFDEIIKLRKNINQTREEKLGLMPILLKIISIAIKKYPFVNSTFNPESMEVSRYENINMAIAVDTPKGLMVPVIKNIQQNSIEEINTIMAKLIKQTREKSVAIEDLRGGTFTVTNYGSHGGLYGNPLILPPQVAILGLGRIHEAPVVKNGQVIPATILPVSFVFDHRIIDGAPASSFVMEIKKLLENPYQIIMNIT